MLHLSRFVAVVALAACVPISKAAETADWVIRARYVVPMDAAHRVIENGGIAIRSNRIVGVGTATDILHEYKATRILHRPNAILMPGLIDTHTHAAMSLLRAIADDKRLQDWLEHYIFPAES